MKKTFNQVIREFYVGKRINIYYSLNVQRDGIDFSVWQPYEGSFFPVIISSCHVNYNKRTINIQFGYRKVSIGEFEASIMDIEFDFDREIEFIY